MQQSAVSKDLEKIRRRVKKEIQDTATDRVWDFAKYLTGMDAVISKLWEIADDKDISPRDRIALDMIMAGYEGRGAETILASKYFERKEKDDDVWKIG